MLLIENVDSDERKIVKSFVPSYTRLKVLDKIAFNLVVCL